MSLLCQDPAAPSPFRVKAKVFPAASRTLRGLAFVPFLICSAARLPLAHVSPLAACHVSNILNTPCGPHIGRFFFREALPVDIPVTSSCVQAHVPLQLGLSCSQPTLLPSTPKKLSPLQCIFLNVPSNHKTLYILRYFVYCLFALSVSS